jgi:hypothetical protein
VGVRHNYREVCLDQSNIWFNQLTLPRRRWRKPPVLGELPTARSMGTADVVGTNVYFWGGYCGGVIPSSQDFYKLVINVDMSSPLWYRGGESISVTNASSAQSDETQATNDSAYPLGGMGGGGGSHGNGPFPASSSRSPRDKSVASAAASSSSSSSTASAETVLVEMRK